MTRHPRPRGERNPADASEPEEVGPENRNAGNLGLKSKAGAILHLSRNDAVAVWVEQATGLLWRATRPPLWVRRECILWFARLRCRNSTASCRRERPSWPCHPDPSTGFRLKRCRIRGPATVKVPLKVLPVASRSSTSSVLDPAKLWFSCFPVLQILSPARVFIRASATPPRLPCPPLPIAPPKATDDKPGAPR